MRSGIITAAFAFLLIGSLSACSTMSQVPDNSTASYRSSVERAGVHDATVNDSWRERTASVGDPYYKGSPDQGFNTPDGKTLANDVKNGVRDIGQDAANGIREAGRDIKESTIQGEKDTKSLMELK